MPFAINPDLIFILDYEKLEPRLEALLQAHAEDAKLAASLEMRISALVDKHAAQVSLTLSLVWFQADYGPG